MHETAMLVALLTSSGVDDLSAAKVVAVEKTPAKKPAVKVTAKKPAVKMAKMAPAKKSGAKDTKEQRHQK